MSNEYPLPHPPVHFGWDKERETVWYSTDDRKTERVLTLEQAGQFWLNPDKDYSPKDGVNDPFGWMKYLQRMNLLMFNLCKSLPGKLRV